MRGQNYQQQANYYDQYFGPYFQQQTVDTIAMSVHTSSSNPMFSIIGDSSITSYDEYYKVYNQIIGMQLAQMYHGQQHIITKQIVIQKYEEYQNIRQYMNEVDLAMMFLHGFKCSCFSNKILDNMKVYFQLECRLRMQLPELAYKIQKNKKITNQQYKELFLLLKGIENVYQDQINNNKKINDFNQQTKKIKNLISFCDSNNNVFMLNQLNFLSKKKYRKNDLLYEINLKGLNQYLMKFSQIIPSIVRQKFAIQQQLVNSIDDICRYSKTIVYDNIYQKIKSKLQTITFLNNQYTSKSIRLIINYIQIDKILMGMIQQILRNNQNDTQISKKLKTCVSLIFINLQNITIGYKNLEQIRNQIIDNENFKLNNIITINEVTIILTNYKRYQQINQVQQFLQLIKRNYKQQRSIKIQIQKKNKIQEANYEKYIETQINKLQKLINQKLKFGYINENYYQYVLKQNQFENNKQIQEQEKIYQNDSQIQNDGEIQKQQQILQQQQISYQRTQNIIERENIQKKAVHFQPNQLQNNYNSNSQKQSIQKREVSREKINEMQQIIEEEENQENQENEDINVKEQEEQEEQKNQVIGKERREQNIENPKAKVRQIANEQDKKSSGDKMDQNSKQQQIGKISFITKFKMEIKMCHKQKPIKTQYISQQQYKKLIKENERKSLTQK